MTTYLASTETAKIIRHKLRESFPGTKFSVRCDRGSAYGWLHVGWTDGPRETAVREVCDPWKGADFNGMTDSYDQRGPLLVATDPGELPTAMHSHVDGILYSRHVSVEQLLAAQEIVREAIPGFTAYDSDGRDTGPDAGRWMPWPVIRRVIPTHAEGPGAGLVRWVAENVL